MADNWRGWQAVAGRIAVKHWQIVPSAAALDPRPWAVFAATDGVAVIEDEAGVSLSYPVKAGQYLPFAPVKVLAATTATLYGWR